MKLKDKILVFSSSVTAVMVVALVVFSTFAFRWFAVHHTESHVRALAETVKIGLSDSTIHGNSAKRQLFLAQLAKVPGVRQVQLVRAAAVIGQFGPTVPPAAAPSAAVAQVLATAKEAFDVLEVEGEMTVRGVVPLLADNLGGGDCLSQCHTVNPGTVLGAVSIDVSLAEVRHQGIIGVSVVGLAVVVAALLAMTLLRRMLQPLAESALAVQAVTTQAVGGNFAGRIGHRSNDEVGDIALNINRLMEFLEREVTTIRTRVGQLVGHQVKADRRANEDGNQLVLTTEMVESLVEASQFKQAIEEDQAKIDIYQRLADMLQRKYDFRRFSIYEVSASKNRMTPIVIDGDFGAPCRYCDQQVTLDAGFCRARRTGHEVNAVDFPGLCTMFRAEDDGDTHICLPITQSGSAGCIVQIVASADEAPLVRLMVPFVAVYLREAGPVLEAKRLMEHLRENALRDAMTGMYNRRFLEEYIGTLVSGSQRRKTAFSVLMLDLDFFKQVNDTHGHEAGDKVLTTLADILMRKVRSSDIAVRYGGEEFLLVLMDTGADAAMQVAEKIRAEVEATKIPLSGGMLQKTISIGVAEYPQDSDTFWQVVKFADVAMYKAKSGGRNRVVRFAAEMWDASASY